MKKIATTLIAIIIILMVIIIATPKKHNSFKSSTKGYNKADLNVRSAPSIEGDIKSTINKNTEILISNTETNGWTLIGNVDSLELGYVSIKYLKSFDSEKLIFQQNKEVETGYLKILLIILSYLLFWQTTNHTYLSNKKYLYFVNINKHKSQTKAFKKFRNSIEIKADSQFYFKPKSILLKDSYIVNWNKKSGENITIDDTICNILINDDLVVQIKSSLTGVIETHKEYRGVDETLHTRRIQPNELLFTIHDGLTTESQKYLLNNRIKFVERIEKDEFTKSKNITWKTVSGNGLIDNSYYKMVTNSNLELYTYKDGFLLKKGDWKEFNFRFTLNYLDHNNYIVFQYDTKNVHKLKHGTTIYFSFEDNEVLQFEITKPYFDQKRGYYKSKAILTHRMLEIFKNNNLIRWQIRPSINGDKITGGISNSYSQSILKKFSEKYLEITEGEIDNHNPILEEINKECYVYLMHDTSNSFYKIGISNSPKYRESTLQSEKPTIELICAKSFLNRRIALDMEQSLHSSYKDKRIRGEWFSLNSNDIKDITGLLN